MITNLNFWKGNGIYIYNKTTKRIEYFGFKTNIEKDEINERKEDEILIEINIIKNKSTF